MGLDTTHGCWHGGYISFMAWRQKLAEAAGIPLALMEGFYSDKMPNSPSVALRLIAEMDKMRRPGRETDWTIEVLQEAFKSFPLKWAMLAPDPLHILLCHSDCEGSIAAADCGPIADSLERLLPALPDKEAGGHIGNWRAKTQTFIDGLRLAASKGEDVEFH